MRETLRIGELAKRTGVSVRALHHYDQIGLLSPSARTEAGYRLYTAADVARLQRIKSLRYLGFSLEEIRSLLAEPSLAPGRIIQLHLARLHEEIELLQRLGQRLENLAARVNGAEQVPIEELIQTIEVISMSERFEKYYTPEQLRQIEQRGRELGEARIRAVEAAWPELIAQVKAEMANGTPSTDERVQALGRRWRELVREFTGGDPGIHRSLNRLWAEETNVHGFDAAEMRKLMEYATGGLG